MEQNEKIKKAIEQKTADIKSEIESARNLLDKAFYVSEFSKKEKFDGCMPHNVTSCMVRAAELLGEINILESILEHGV